MLLFDSIRPFCDLMKSFMTPSRHCPSVSGVPEANLIIFSKKISTISWKTLFPSHSSWSEENRTYHQLSILTSFVHQRAALSAAQRNHPISPLGTVDFIWKQEYKDSLQLSQCFSTPHITYVKTNYVVTSLYPEVGLAQWLVQATT